MGELWLVMRVSGPITLYLEDATITRLGDLAGADKTNRRRIVDELVEKAWAAKTPTNVTRRQRLNSNNAPKGDSPNIGHKVAQAVKNMKLSKGRVRS